MAAFGKQGAEYSVNYSLMGGVDFSSHDSISGRRRYSYLENMYRDYDGEGAELTESVPGFRKIFSIGAKINAFYLQRIKKGDEHLIIHAGNKLYRTPLADIDKGLTLSPLRTVNDTKSTGFSFGKNVYLLDGGKIARIDETGTVSFVSDGSAAAAYIPTTYVNGKEYEQLNLLTRQFYEEFYVTFHEDVAYESPGLLYRISDKDMKKCAVTGVGNSFSGELFIPSYANIGGERFEIEKIDEKAFLDNSTIKSVTISDGIKEISKKAFSGASKLTKVTLPDSVRTIGEGAFENAPLLSEIRLGKDLISIGSGAFTGCESLTTVKYASDPIVLIPMAANAGIPSSAAYKGYVKDDVMRAKIPIMTPTDVLVELKIGEEEYSFTEVYDGELVKEIIIPSVEKRALESAFIRIRGYAHRTKFNFNTPGINFISVMGGIEPCDAINKCTVSECFDGRVFLSGNPSFPNTVFYSARDRYGNMNPLYFGVMNYFNDGVGGFPVISLLSSGDALAVFKSGDDGSGSIFYHAPKETGIDILPKVYPVSYIHSGIYAVGESISFLDDPVFVSALGVSALDKKAINLDRSIACRSHNVNPELLSQDLSRASFAVWCGYLVLLVDGKIFLADSRAPFRHETGNTEYEWYYLSGIGTFTGDDFVYEYIKSNAPGCETREDSIGEKTTSAVYSATNSQNGSQYFYVVEDGKHYSVGKTNEKHGGEFHPATLAFAIDNKLLFFGTDNGDVCVFNNDKRGVPPKNVAAAEGFDEESYSASMKRSIHPDFYSFAGHAPRYALSTVKDDGGIHDMTKDTVKGSFVLKCKSFGKGEICVEVGTDKKGYREIAAFSDSRLNFEDLDFSALAFFGEKSITLPIAEKEKGWTEKEVSLYSEKFASPIGIYSISYRLRPRGKIKTSKL